MGRVKHRRFDESTSAPEPAAETAAVSAAHETLGEQSPPRHVAKHRQCPTCFGGAMRGIGLCYATRDSKRYYKCAMCGHTWTATILPAEVVQIENRQVDLSTR